MGRDRRIVDSVGNEALVTAALDALKVDIQDTEGTTISDLETVLEAIETLLEGTQLSKVWDGTHTLDVNADGSIPVTGTVSIQEPLSVDDNGGSLTVDQGTPANLKTQIYGLYDSTPTAIAVDSDGKLITTF